MDRAILFVDGNNWYHGLRNAGVKDQMRLDWVRIARKLVGSRQWLGTRYYIGQVEQQGNATLYADQRRFHSQFLAAHANHTMHFGRLESRRAQSEAAKELLEYLGKLKVRIDANVYKDLVALGQRHRQTVVRVEKAVDVMLAVDMVTLASEKQYEVAYLLSADGDYTHAVEFVRKQGLTVFAVSASSGAQLARVSNSFIRVDATWFAGLYL